MLPLEDLSLTTVMREGTNLADAERRLMPLRGLSGSHFRYHTAAASAFNTQYLCKLPHALIVTKPLELTNVCSTN